MDDFGFQQHGIAVDVRQAYKPGECASITVTTQDGKSIDLQVQSYNGGAGFAIIAPPSPAQGTLAHLDEVVRQGNLKQFGDGRPLRRS